MKTQQTTLLDDLKRYTRREPIFFFAVSLLVIGVSLFLYGFVCRTERLDSLQHAIRTTGIVTDYYHHFDGEHTTFAPIVRFLPEDTTKPITIVSQLREAGMPYKVGTSVSVWYRRGHPYYADLEEMVRSQNTEIVFFAFGLLIGLSGIVMTSFLLQEFWKTNRRKRHLLPT